jgi:preprotein translocase subunit SecY
LFTLGLLAVYRLGGHVPTPGINTIAVGRVLQFATGGSLFSFFDMFAGGNIRRLTVFRPGHHAVHHGIHHSAVAHRGGSHARKTAERRRTGPPQDHPVDPLPDHHLSVIQSTTIAGGLQSMQGKASSSIPAFGFILLTIISLTTGTAFIMWLGEQISERGVGNGMSLIIFTGIVVGLPRAIGNIYHHTFVTHEWNPLQLIVIMAMMVAVVAFIVLVERGERRIPVQYAKRVVGRRVMGGQSTHMPLKVNAGGVIPVIFASSILAFPQTLADERRS